MKLPRRHGPAGSPLPPLPARGRGRGLEPSAFELQICTTNLGARGDEPGDPSLPHCLVRVRDLDGQPLRSLSIGRDGLGPEHNADVPSCRCAPSPTAVEPAELRRFERALQGCADQGYAWGERDCCSCITRAFTEGLGRDAPVLVRDAAARLAAAPDPLAATE